MALQETNFSLKKNYHPGTISRIVELHATYYSTHWGFGAFFEAKVASELSQFILRYDPDKDLLLTAWIDNQIQGSIVIDGQQAHNEGAHLRWFIVSEPFMGRGIGKRLLNEAIAFSHKKHYQKIYLWTFEGLDAARHLYESVGFKLAKQQKGKQWGIEVTEQLFQWDTHETVERLGR
ncbi:MAG: GNAT family N-acetyltransferase [Deltaproteobacteria bacterium]|nr:GNAT family N-acetyltransferase [Deltaproteobacteria bacterium]MBW1930033.1 GNAT family N-acetyltransferase [Deltaproteobacteria bacterium]MBW2027306.1 GNAT family N-acetyltransferase [Deltaproteobacteria bacterium]MBW2127496.1 GNAT family N-acetyltransferase [Deltaproteobacteria bacterium]